MDRPERLDGANDAIQRRVNIWAFVGTYQTRFIKLGPVAFSCKQVCICSMGGPLDRTRRLKNHVVRPRVYLHRITNDF
jgi:hypothetical protein